MAYPGIEAAAFIALRLVYDKSIYNSDPSDRAQLKTDYGLQQSFDQAGKGMKLINWAIVNKKGESEVYMAFRGSSTTDDWLIDANMVPGKIYYESGSKQEWFYVHGGFANVLENSWEDIMEGLKNFLKENPQKKFTLSPTGHSLGGGLAQIFCLKYGKNPIADLPLSENIYTFAAPMVFWNEQKYPLPIDTVGKITNFCTKGDPVTRALGATTLLMVKAVGVEMRENLPWAAKTALNLLPADVKKLKGVITEKLGASTLLTSFEPVSKVCLLLNESKQFERLEIIQEATDQLNAYNDKGTKAGDLTSLGIPFDEIEVMDHIQSFYFHSLVQCGLYSQPSSDEHTLFGKFTITSHGGEKVGLVGEKEIGLVKKEIAGPMTEWTHDKDNGYLRLFGGKDTHVLGYSKKRAFAGLNVTNGIEMVPEDSKHAVKVKINGYQVQIVSCNDALNDGTTLVMDVKDDIELIWYEMKGPKKLEKNDGKNQIFDITFVI